MNKNNFILYESFNESLSRQKFEEAKNAYLQSLEVNKYAIKNAETIYELIINIKRAPEKIGPYQNISVFEALNRIGTDLVLLSGATKLFKGEINSIQPESIHLKMGTTKGFDFEVYLKGGKIVYGEAFNAAESFCKHKMRQAIHKLISPDRDKNITEGIVFINESVEPVISKYINKHEKESSMKIHRVYCNDIFSEVKT